MAAIQSDNLRGKLRLDEPMSRHTSWRAGGLAKQYYKPADIDDLIVFLQQVPVSETLVWLGLGSNMLVRDGGIHGTVIDMKGVNQEIEQISATRIRFEAGVTCSKAARFSARAGLSGAEFFAGIPGTIGGSLTMNAGAFGGDTWSHVVEVRTIDRLGCLHTRQPSEFDVSYRSVKALSNDDGKAEWFVSGLFEFSESADEEGKQRIKEMLERRNKTQPIGLPSCGSVFTNPENDHAARLIESCGLKGHCIGKACVSEKHSNFIINTGDALASDIESLIKHVQQVVEQDTGIKLHPEVHIIGEQE